MLYYSCVVLFLVPLMILYFPWYVEVSWILIRTYFSLKSRKGFSKNIVLDGQMELIFKPIRTFILCSYHFNTPSCVILQYPQSKREILCQKEKQYSVKVHHFFRILCLMDIFFKRLIIYQSGIKVNIGNM